MRKHFSILHISDLHKPKTRMNVLRLGNDFEVKVLNPNAEIEKGVDESSGKEYFTLYFE